MNILVLRKSFCPCEISEKVQELTVRLETLGLLEGTIQGVGMDKSLLNQPPGAQITTTDILDSISEKASSWQCEETTVRSGGVFAAIHLRGFTIQNIERIQGLGRWLNG